MQSNELHHFFPLLLDRRVWDRPSLIWRGKNSPPNHSLRINIFAKATPLLLHGGCAVAGIWFVTDTNQLFAPDVGSMEMLQTQPLALPTAAEFLLRSVFTNAICSGGAGRTHPDFILYLLRKLWVTAEAAAAQMGRLQNGPSRASPLPAGHREAEDPGSASHKGLQSLWCIPKIQPESQSNCTVTEDNSKLATVLVGCRQLWPVMKSWHYASEFRSGQQVLTSRLVLVWTVLSFSFSILRVANKYHNRI